MSILGERIKSLREERALTQGELGQVIGVSNITISKYESGNVVPPTHRIVSLAQYFGVSVGYMIGEREKIF